jgi:hypothetical protein
MSRRHPLGPRVHVAVKAETINTSMRANSSHCMIAEAIKLAVPEAKHVAVDISTIRWSDPAKGLRYVYLTPRVAQEALVDFDEGTPPSPFSFILRGAHVSRAGRPPGPSALVADAELGKPGKGGKKRPQPLPTRAKLQTDGKDSRPHRVGGRRPPQLHHRREFGMRGFRAAALDKLKREPIAPPLPGGPPVVKPRRRRHEA